MAWNRIQMSAKSGRKSESTPVQNPGSQDDKVLLKEIGFTLLHKIGHGSFSRVWKAKSPTYRDEVAIKIIKRRRASKEFLEKFLPRELDIIQNIRHRNLLKYYEISDSPYSVYIVMQYAENGTLATLIEREKTVHEMRARLFFTQLMDVVEFLHRNGIVHRDIKCENLLLDGQNKLMLSDFGFARSDVLPGSDGRISKSRTYCGSYAYASPEILSNTPYNPFCADVWCMGMVLYNMMVGTIPYRQTDIKTLITAKKQPPQFPPEPAVSEVSQNFIRRMLSLEPSRASIPQLRKDTWMADKYQSKGSLRETKVLSAAAGSSRSLERPRMDEKGTSVATFQRDEE